MSIDAADPDRAETEQDPTRLDGGDPSPTVADLLDRAWRAWEAGDGDALLALLAQARAAGPTDAAARAWIEEAELVAREQTDIARYHRTRTLLGAGDIQAGLQQWLGLSASARAAVRDQFDLPEFAWVSALEAVVVDAVVALGNARTAIAAADVPTARTLLAPHRGVLERIDDGRAALVDLDRAAAPPRPASPTPPAAPPASSAAIASLASHLASGGNFKVPAASPQWPIVLALALRDLLPGRDLDADVDRIANVIDGREGWAVLPPHIAVRLLEFVAARLRALKAAGKTDRRLDQGFSNITAWSRTAKPGFAYGLMRDHQPRLGSWDADADAALDNLYNELPVVEPTPQTGKRLAALEALVVERRTGPPEVREAVAAQIRAEVAALLAEGVSARHTRLVRIVAPVADDLTSPDMRVLRRAARDAAAAEEAEQDDGNDSALPTDWAWWPATRGRRGVIVGGDPREPNRVRLEQTFGFRELAWEPAEGSRTSLQKVRDRVRAGGLDVVFILTRFVGHDADQVILPACKDAGVPFVPVQTGYGIAGVRRAIERFVQVGVGAGK